MRGDKAGLVGLFPKAVRVGGGRSVGIFLIVFGVGRRYSVPSVAAFPSFLYNRSVCILILPVLDFYTY